MLLIFINSIARINVLILQVTPTREKPRNVKLTREREGDDLNEELLKEKRNADRQNAKLSKVRRSVTA